MSKPIAVATAVPATITFASLPQVVQLDGSTSFDPDGFSITAYQWTLVYKPPGSAAALSSSTIVNPTFTADVQGSYRFFLVVTSADPTDSESETVQKSAPNSAFAEATAETENFDWSIPATGSRNWTDRLYEIFTEIDTNLAIATGFTHTFSRTDSDTARFIFNDLRTVGAPFLTSDYLVSLSNKNATGHTGQDERGAIQLDMEQADSAGEASFAFEQTDGDGFAVLDGTPWRAILMKGPVPTGSEVPVLVQLGVDAAEVANGQLFRGFWNESGTNVLQLWKLEHSGNHQSILEITEELDIDDAGLTTQYYILKPDHVSGGGSIQDQRLRLERTRLMLRREIFVHTKSPADADFDKDFYIRVWLDGRAAASQPKFGWTEDDKQWQVKGIANTDAVVHGTGTGEKTRVEHGQVSIFNTSGATTATLTGFVAYDRAFANAPLCGASLVGTTVGDELGPDHVYAFPRAGNTTTHIAFEVRNATVIWEDGDHVHLVWWAIGNDVD